MIMGRRFRGKVNWVLDRDIVAFFDTVSHDWLIRFVEHRIGDKRVIRLIRKWLKAGVLEDGKVETTEVGTTQGAVISPLLANVYLHYVFDLWAERWKRREAKGDMVIVRYADDIVVGFQHQAEAGAVQDRADAAPGGLCVASASGQDAPHRVRPPRGDEPKEARPWQAGAIRLPRVHPYLWALAEGMVPAPAAVAPRPPARPVARHPREPVGQPTRADRRARALAAASHERLVRLSCRVPCNYPSLNLFRRAVIWHSRRALRRRGQRETTSWADILRLANRWLPKARILHPWPSQRYAVRPKVGAGCLNRARPVLCGG
jgi:hypothetical protein